MSTQLKISLALVSAFALAVAVLLGLAVTRDDPAAPAAEGESVLVRADSHVLGEPGSGDVTFVEFLDLECEACRAVYPAIEQLREEYAGRVTFVVRYFPLPGHFNAERAARAVEAAAQQGEFEAMYSRMYETQDAWGEQRVPLDDLFRSFAEDLDLDLEQYDADYAAEATAARVEKDVADGTSLGVQGTPTFFLDGERFEPTSYDDLTEALDAALDD